MSARPFEQLRHTQLALQLPWPGLPCAQLLR